MPGDRGQLRQQRLQQPQVAEVLAVRGGVLADQHQLADALRGQPGGLGQQLVGRPGDERAAEGRDRAERAAPVAAGGDLERGDRAESPSRRRSTGGVQARHRPPRTRARAPTPRGRLPLDRRDRQQRAPVARGVCGRRARRRARRRAARRCPRRRRSRARRRPRAGCRPAPRRTARPGSRPRRPSGRASAAASSVSIESFLALATNAQVLTSDDVGVVVLGELPAVGGQPARRAPRSRPRCGHSRGSPAQHDGNGTRGRAY